MQFVSAHGNSITVSDASTLIPNIVLTNKFLDIRIDDPIPLYTYLITRIRERFPDLAYIHVTEPRISGDGTSRDPRDESNDFIRALWSPRPLISTGGYDRDLAIEIADTKGDLIAFGRHFIANVRLETYFPLSIADNMPSVA